MLLIRVKQVARPYRSALDSCPALTELPTFETFCSGQLGFDVLADQMVGQFVGFLHPVAVRPTPMRW